MVAFDKTGTLTLGKPELVAEEGVQGGDPSVLSIAASLQAGSDHPLAFAVVEAARKQDVVAEPVIESRALPGRGISGQVKGFTYLFGNRQLMQEHDLQLGIFNDRATALENEGCTISWLARKDDKNVLGFMAFRDQVKPEAAEAIKRLHALGIETVMITGDNKGSAAVVAGILGVDHYVAEVLPQEKEKEISRLKKKGLVAMVGDGINDAPALAAADVGIAMSDGTDVAMHTATITLMRGDLLLIADAVDISRQTWRKIQQNLFWAFSYNLVGIPLAAFGLLNPMVAGAAMAFSSVSVVTNALLLKAWKPLGEGRKQ